MQRVAYLLMALIKCNFRGSTTIRGDLIRPRVWLVAFPLFAENRCSHLIIKVNTINNNKAGGQTKLIICLAAAAQRWQFATMERCICACSCICEMLKKEENATLHTDTRTHTHKLTK